MGDPSSFESFRRRVLLPLFALLCAIALGGCQSEPLPDLVTVKELSPRQVELKDRLEIRGAGFPEGRLARIELSGTLLRPGETPLTHVVATGEGRVVSSERLEVDVTEALFAELGGGRHLETHATFRGRLLVSFPALQPGAPPVTGQLKDTVLDVTPPKSDAEELGRRRNDATAFARGLGLELGDRTSDGLAVTEVQPGSRAEDSGIAAGDVLVELDGLSLFDVSDFITVDEARALVLVQNGEHRTTRPLDVRGLGRTTLESSRNAYALAFGVSLVVLVLFAPLSLSGARGIRPPPRRRFGLAALGRLVARADKSALLFLLGSTSACLVVLSGAFSFDGEILALLLTPLGLDLALAFSETKLRSAGRASARAIALHAPLVAIGVGASYVAGSTRAIELAAQSAPWPLALRSLPMLALLLVTLWTRARGPRPLASRAPIVLDGAADVLYATAFTVLFLGGAAPGGALGTIAGLVKIALFATLLGALRVLFASATNVRAKSLLRHFGFVVFPTLLVSIGLATIAKTHGRAVLPIAATWVIVAVGFAGVCRTAIAVRTRLVARPTARGAWMDTLPDPFV